MSAAGFLQRVDSQPRVKRDLQGASMQEVLEVLGAKVCPFDGCADLPLTPRASAAQAGGC